MAKKGEVRWTFVAETGQWERQVKKVEVQFAGLTGKAAGLAKLFAGGLGVGGGIAAFNSLTSTLKGVASTVVSNNIEFERLTTQIKTLTVGGEADLRRFNEGLVGMASATAAGPQELAKALFFVESAGIRGAAALETTQAAAMAAKVGLGESAVVARTVVSAMNAYSSSNLGATETVDKLIEIVRQGGAEASGYATALGQVLPVAASLGVSLDEVGGFMAIFTRQGVGASEAASSLRGALLAMAAPGSASAKALAEAGVSAERLRHVMREEGLNVALAELMEAFDGNVGALKKAIPRVEGLAGVLAVAGDQAGEYRDAVEAIEDAHGNLAEVTRETSDTIGYQWDRMVSVINAGAISPDSLIGATTIGALRTVTALVEQLSKHVPGEARTFEGLTPAEMQRAIDQKREEFLRGLKAAGLSGTGIIDDSDREEMLEALGMVREAQDDLWESSGLAADGAARLAETLDDQAEAGKEAAKEAERMARGLSKMERAQLKSAMASEDQALALWAVTDEMTNFSALAATMPGAIAAATPEEMMTGVLEGFEAAGEEATRLASTQEGIVEETIHWEDALKGVALMASALGGNFGDALQVVENIGQIFQDWDTMSTNQRIAAGGQATSMLGGQIGGHGGAIVEGAGAGASMGSAGGPIGAIVGGVFGGVIAGTQYEGDPLENARAAAQKILGYAVTTEMATQFLAQAEATGMSVGRVVMEWSSQMKRALREEGMALAVEGISMQVAALGGAPQYAEIAARNFNVVFWETVRSEGLPAALEAFEELFAQLRAAFGDELPPGFARLENLFALMNDPAIAAQLQFAQGQAQFVSGATLAGFYDPSMTQDSVNIANDTLAQLRDQGVSDRDAYQMIGGLLTAELNAAIVSGQGIDAGLQALLDEAQANGVQILPSIAVQQLDVLKQIYKNLSGQTYIVPGSGSGPGETPTPPVPGGDPEGEIDEELEGESGRFGNESQQMAVGGIVTGPTHALIGERGPEAVMPLADLMSGFARIEAAIKEQARATPRAIRDAMATGKGG